MSAPCTIRLIDGVGNSIILAVPKLPYVYHVARYFHDRCVVPADVSSPASAEDVVFINTGDADAFGHRLFRQRGYENAPMRPARSRA